MYAPVTKVEYFTDAYESKNSNLRSKLSVSNNILHLFGILIVGNSILNEI